MPDWLGQASINANGVGVVRITHDNPAVVWEMEQISGSVGTTSTSGNIAIFKNGNLVAPTSSLVPQINADGISGIGQTAAGLPYAYLSASDELQVVVNGATSGDTLTVRAQYREFPSDDPNVRGR